jgi:hypothetical protein
MEAKIHFLPRTMNMRLFVLRETAKFFVLIGTDKTLQRQHVIRILKRDDMTNDYELGEIIVEDKNSYDAESFDAYLLELKARYAPVTTKVRRAFGIIGFIRFLKGFYLILITSKKRVGKIGRHSIY